jgi:hypothetical protein
MRRISRLLIQTWRSQLPACDANHAAVDSRGGRRMRVVRWLGSGCPFVRFAYWWPRWISTRLFCYSSLVEIPRGRRHPRISIPGPFLPRALQVIWSLNGSLPRCIQTLRSPAARRAPKPRESCGDRELLCAETELLCAETELLCAETARQLRRMVSRLQRAKSTQEVLSMAEFRSCRSRLWSPVFAPVDELIKKLSSSFGWFRRQRHRAAKTVIEPCFMHAE